MPSITQTPATFTSDPSAGTAAWATPTGALASDDSYAVASVEGLGSSQRLRGVGPAFAGIPAGSAIVGIEVLVEAAADTSGGAVFEFAEVSLVVAGRPLTATETESPAEAASMSRVCMLEVVAASRSSRSAVLSCCRERS